MAQTSDVLIVVQLVLSARIGLHDPTAAQGHVYAVHDGGDVARSGGRPCILILHAQVPRTTGIQDYAHDSLPSGAEPVTTGPSCYSRGFGALVRAGPTERPGGTASGNARTSGVPHRCVRGRGGLRRGARGESSAPSKRRRTSTGPCRSTCSMCCRPCRPSRCQLAV
eukprot:scaffold67284_cov66-Phaeocystis_antarctica.AAC.4